MYSPGSVKLAEVVALPSASFAVGAEKFTSPGPRYFAHIAVIPTVLPCRFGSPSSVAVRVSVVDAGAVGDCSLARTVTAGGRFELIFSLLPPRVVRRRSICHTGFSVPTTCWVWPCAVSFQTSFCSPKSFGTVTLNTSLCRRGVKCVGWPRSPPGSNVLLAPTGRSIDSS